MKHFTVASALLALPALAVDVAFMQGEACSGQPLYGMKGLDAVTCYDITDDVAPRSVDFRNLAAQQKVRLFSDTECTQKLYSTTSKACYIVSGDNIAAFTVTNTTNAPQVGEYEEFQSKEMTKDVVEYGVKLSNYKGMEAAPFSSNIRYSNSFIGASAIGTASGLSFASGVAGCYSAVAGGGPLSIFSCIAGPIATILSWVGYYSLARAGEHIQDNINWPLELDDRNFAFMHSVMNVTGSQAVHTGKLMHRTLSTGDHVSPIYELTGGDGINYHFSAFYDDETGSFVHHIAPEHEIQLDKRAGPGYNNVRYSSGGMDFSFCKRSPSSSKAVYYQRSMQQLYNIYYKDLKCLVAPNDLKNNEQLLVDMYNGNSVLVGEVHIAPYKKSGPVNNNRYVINQCSQRKAYMTPSCIN